MRSLRHAPSSTMIGALGGGLRAAASFTPMFTVSEGARNLLYLAIDICLAVGLLGFYLPRRRRTRAAGTIGAFLALGGLIAGRIGPVVTSLDVYPVTAAAVVIGVLVLAFGEWRIRRTGGWLPLTFALSLVLGGIGTFVARAGMLFILSGILFGCGFAAMVIIDTGMQPTA